MKEVDKILLKTVGCIILFLLSAVTGLLLAFTENSWILILCIVGLFFSFFYGLFNFGELQHIEKIEEENKMLVENDKYYSKMKSGEELIKKSCN